MNSWREDSTFFGSGCEPGQARRREAPKSRRLGASKMSGLLNEGARGADVRGPSPKQGWP